MFGFIQQFDTHVLYALVSIRSPSMNACMEFVSVFGQWYIVLPLGAIAVVSLALQKFYLEARELAFTVVGTTAAVLIVKQITARPRPPESLRLVQEIGYSFPSWHAAISVAFWGYLSFLAMRQIKHRLGRVFVALLCAGIALIIGFSRLYLGVHYFSDVIGGFLFGLTALYLSVHYTRRSAQQ